MKLTNANTIREKLIAKLMEYFAEEDIGKIASNSFNFPIVADDGEEGWVEIVVKVPKDDADEGYLKREDYEIKVKEKAEKTAEAEKKKQAKIEKDKKEREAKKRAKEENA